MSLNGSVTRSMTLLGVELYRGLDEDDLALLPSRTLTVIAGPVELRVHDCGWSLARRLRDLPRVLHGELFVAGLSISVDRSCESFERRYSGDAEIICQPLFSESTSISARTLDAVFAAFDGRRSR